MKVLMPIPEMDFDPTEVAVTWRSLRDRGIEVVFATPTGGEGEADHIMLTGEGLDPWGVIPLFRKLPLLGLLLRADRQARLAYGELEGDPSFQDPLMYTEMRAEDFDGMVLCGGHRARGMQQYLESNTLRKFIGAFFATGKPVGAICHGVLLAARSRSPLNGKSVLYGRKTTALTWSMERRAWNLTRFWGRFWDPNYYRTYVENKGQPKGSKSVEYEVKAYLERPTDFIDVEGSGQEKSRKMSGLHRDSEGRSWAAHVVVDDNYVSARWPGDAYTFAKRFGEVLAEVSQRRETQNVPHTLEAQMAAEPAYDPFAKTQILSRMPKGGAPVEDFNHTIIIKSSRPSSVPKTPEPPVEPAVAAPIPEPVAEQQPGVATAAAVTLAPTFEAPLAAHNATEDAHVKTVALAEPPLFPEAPALAEKYVSTQELAASANASLQAEAVAPDFAKTMVLSAPLLQEAAAGDGFAKTQVLAEPPSQEPALESTSEAADPLARTQILSEPAAQDVAPEEQFAKTQVLSQPAVQESAPDDPFAKTQVFSAVPVQGAAPVDDFAKTQVFSEPPLQAAPADEFAKTQVLSEPPLQAAPVDEFAKTQVLPEPPLQAAPADEVAKTQVLSEPPLQVAPNVDFEKTQILKPAAARSGAPVDDFEKTQVLSRPPELVGEFMTSSVDDFDRTLIVKRPTAEELEKSRILVQSGK